MSVFFGPLNGVQGDLVSGLARLTAGALVAGLWQGAFLCVVAGLMLRMVPRSTAALRFVVWAAVFCVSVAMPFVYLPHAASVASGRDSRLVFDLRWSYVLSGLWLAASLYRLGELAVQVAGLLAMWKSAVPISHDWLAGMEGSLRLRGRRVEVCTSDDVDRPSVIGFFKPRILIPSWLFEKLAGVELNHIVLHEMEHLRRRDEWVNLLQKVGLVLLPLNPALCWIDRRLSTERELACDDGVLERTKMPRAYAASLASVAERRLDARNGRRIGMLALAATGLLRRRSELGRRIESILGLRTPVNRAFTGFVAAILVTTVLGASVELTRVPQVVSFGSSAQASASTNFSPNGRVGLVAGASVEEVSFHASGARSSAGLAKGPQSVPQRLKPLVGGGAHGTAKAAPLSTTKGSEVGRTLSVDVTGSSHSRGDSALATLVAKTEPSSAEQFVVLTSWDGDQPVTRVAVATHDGKFVLLPYAAVPTQAGWLLIQL